MRSVLIANRGEIACRIVRSCRALGIETVAVYSEADAAALHVETADRAVPIGPAPARESYLAADRLLEAARATGVDAVHPGYGFLAENADFAERVTAAGLAWIGPRPKTIRAMGDKATARRLAQEAGVPVVPGSRTFAEGDLAGVEEAAAAVGYPLLVKAAAGGGGIGMRRVDDPAKLVDTAASTQSMAAKAFGDGTVFLEHFIPKARHVEVQVFGFGGGDAVHFYERDCSLQRRFQKVVEEAPAPGLAPELRARMAEAATALARHVGYNCAGTVEFILDADTGEFFFLEMNTRIQVEHPVTEETTGFDLIRLQIEFAHGTLRTLEQSAIERHGHAIECRLYAENPQKRFMPSPGPLERFVLPAGMADVRVDTGYREGDIVTPHYDPLIAKIIADGVSRDAAIATMDKALEAVEIEGVRTNRDFLLACMRDEGFRAGDVFTGFIDAHHETLLGR